ncbi:MAG: T9SS type A sorting domain-containing protein [Crocinitomicaceae bacterium]|nr:T9SS type A sorting domain-containing protein [Crocinitomicaceae bacterium]
MRITPLLFAFSMLLQAEAQITIDNTTYSTSQLVSDILIPSGSGTIISNVNFRGCLNVSNRYQAGYFSTNTSTQSQMGMSSGIVLSTGNTADIPLSLGTNPGSVSQMSRNYTSGSAGEIRSSNPASGQDADADNLIAPENYYNAAILEFDFVPVTTFVEFKYVFGSEEYDDVSGSAFGINYNCSGYNDKFAFLLSGPGITGGQGYQNDAINIARLSNNSEVGINSVNNGNVGSSGGSPSASKCLATNGSWTNGTPTPEFNGFIDGTELNGNTNILTATYASLIAGQTYHIRLLIADAKDGAYDSVVYLEESSFITTPTNLPTELASFQGDCDNQGVNITWSTESEKDNAFFEIEHSTDGERFNLINTTNGMINSQEPTHYHMEHNMAAIGVNYYLLSQTDLDGTKNILKTISVNNTCNNSTMMTSYYNQRDNLLNLRLGNPLRNYSVYLYNSVGQLIQYNSDTTTFESQEINIPLIKSVSPGIYHIKLTTKDSQYNSKILIK